MVDSAPGVELWVWFKNDVQDINKQWKELANSLSGLFCASLNFIDIANSYSPEYTLRPKGLVNGPVNSTLLRYASLPREVVCTENLTPWKKLLPCDSHKGLASLLNSGYIHNNRYHSLGLSFRQICRSKDCQQTAIELRQTVSLVYDYLILLNRNWSFRKLFGQGLFDSCPLATKSDIYVDITSNVSVPFLLSPEPHEIIKSTRGADERTLAKYDVKKMSSHVLNVAVAYTEKEVVSLNPPPVLHANQYLSSVGQESGYLVHKIYNNYWDQLEVILFKNLPWYVPIYLHTLRVRSNGKDIKPFYIKYSPGISRERPYHLELLLKLPPRSTTIVSVEFEFMFLQWQEYPPDANHGFYIGSSILMAKLPNARNYTALPLEGTLIASSFNASRVGYLVQIRTESIILTLPTPDFSMPYNVICLACTVVALAFGPLHNITTKKMVYRAPAESKFIKKIKMLFCPKKDSESK